MFSKQFTILVENIQFSDRNPIFNNFKTEFEAQSEQLLKHVQQSQFRKFAEKASISPSVLSQQANRKLKLDRFPSAYIN